MSCRLFLVFIFLGFASEVFAQHDNPIQTPYYIFPRTEGQHIDLSGSWELSYMDEQIESLSQLANRKDPFQTQVPNSVQWSLFKAGKLPHPYAHVNSVHYRIAEDKVWYYRKDVTIPGSAEGKLVFLRFDGVDYFSRVWVNGKLVGEHEGMFGGPTVDISGLARYGEVNEITVEVRSANFGNRRDYAKGTGFNPRAIGNIIKPWVISGGVGTEAFFSVGMWQGVRIEIVPEFHIERPFMRTVSASADEARLHLSFEVFTDKHSLLHSLHPWGNAQIHHPNASGVSYPPLDEKMNASIGLYRNGRKVFEKEISLSLYKGRNWVEEELIIPDPQLWQPVGLGEPNLYQVRVSLMKDGTTIDKLNFNYGIRTVERVPTAGPRTFDRWENWQFIVNGRRIFVKGMNWTPADVLLDLPKERYRWALEAARDMGVQLIRVWGGGILETNEFYDLCNELGIMVWQDFPIGNQDTPDFPQATWEAQVVQNILRLRNHPSLVVWCGGNEFNPYSRGNAATIGILERNLDIFDKTRLFVRTTPDDGSIHIYPDMDPTWYDRSYRYEAWISETGMHSMPEPALFYELVDNKEFFGLGRMWDDQFAKDHPEFIHHFTEYQPSRVPRMLSRASHIVDMTDPSLEEISEASQVGAGEWYQIVSEKMQGNYPVTAGLMPWVFKRHWPVIAIQMMDWFGQAAAPYYFLKRTYEPTHVALDLPRLLWKGGETITLTAKVTHAPSSKIHGAKARVICYDDKFAEIYRDEAIVDIAAGPSVTTTPLGSYSIPSDYRDRFLFALIELEDASGKLISRSYYYPRVLERLEDEAFYEQYINEPIPWINLDNGPWLKPTVAETPAKLTANVVDVTSQSSERATIKVRVQNRGKVPAFMVKVDIESVKRVFYASDNFLWLPPGETVEIILNVQWREKVKGKNAKMSISAWNAKKQIVPIKMDRE